MQIVCQEVNISRGTGAAEGRWTLNKAAGEKTLIGDKCDAREWSLSCTGKHLNGGVLSQSRYGRSNSVVDTPGLRTIYAHFGICLTSGGVTSKIYCRSTHEGPRGKVSQGPSHMSFPVSLNTVHNRAVDVRDHRTAIAPAQCALRPVVRFDALLRFDSRIIAGRRRTSIVCVIAAPRLFW